MRKSLVSGVFARACTASVQLRRCAVLPRAAPVLVPPARGIAAAAWHSRLLSTAGRSAADNLSDELHDANLLLTDLVEDDDRSSDDFQNDLAELRTAYARVVEAYEGALAAEAGASQVAVKKSFELAVVGLRDKLSALEAEAS